MKTTLYAGLAVLGREVHRERREQGAGGEQWRMTLPAGTYVLRVQAGAVRRSYRLVVQR